jgi:NAD(P)H-flavin reductase
LAWVVRICTRRRPADHPDLSGWRVFLCGNPDMVNAAKRETYLAPPSRTFSPIHFNQRTIWFISMMGSRMASTMVSTTPPINRISSGSSKEVSTEV